MCRFCLSPLQEEVLHRRRFINVLMKMCEYGDLSINIGMYYPLTAHILPLTSIIRPSDVEGSRKAAGAKHGATRTPERSATSNARGGPKNQQTRKRKMEQMTRLF